MARKTIKYEVKDKGRDNGKVFVITEMPARQAHSWATQAIFAIMNAGVDVPENIAEMGMAGLAAVGVKALGGIPHHVAQPLLDELFECIQIMPDKNRPEVVRCLIDDDTEEVMTLFKLQKEAIGLHVNFSMPEGKSTSGKQGMTGQA
jgi:hypothetical protein